jgi:GTP cyclohydrolase I
MNSYATEPAPSHGDLLADRLRRLDNLDDQSVQASEQIHPTPVLPNKAPNPYDGYGFRPPSGMTPPRAPNSPLPDVNGLGWPGASSFFLVILFPLTPPPPRPAKATLSRLNASPAENATRQTRLAGAVRTVLECIGEDPDREGLLRTPERYAQALMWMTKGYEERLTGRFFMPTPRLFFSRVHVPPP